MPAPQSHHWCESCAYILATLELDTMPILQQNLCFMLCLMLCLMLRLMLRLLLAKSSAER